MQGWGGAGSPPGWLTRIMCPVEMSMLDWTGSSHQEGVLLWELGLGWGASLNWDETLLTLEVSAGAAGASERPKRDLAAMCWRHSSWGSPARVLSLGHSAATGQLRAPRATPTRGGNASCGAPHPAGPYLVLEGGVGSPLRPQGSQALLLPLPGVAAQAEGRGHGDGDDGHAGQRDEGQQHRVETVPEAGRARVGSSLAPLGTKTSKG